MLRRPESTQCGIIWSTGIARGDGSDRSMSAPVPRVELHECVPRLGRAPSQRAWVARVVVDARRQSPELSLLGGFEIAVEAQSGCASRLTRLPQRSPAHNTSTARAPPPAGGA